MTEPNEPEDVQIPSYEELVEQRNRPRSLHHALKLAVRAGEITPRQAEEKAREQGHPLWYGDWRNKFDVTLNSVWWLPQTVIFYSWLDLRRTWEQCVRYEVWGYDLWQEKNDHHIQPFSLQEAEDQFRSDLSAGLVRAFGFDVDNVKRPIPYEEWNDLTFGYEKDHAVNSLDGRVRYSGVFILRNEVVSLLISERLMLESYKEEEKSEEIAPAQMDRIDIPVGKRGRKPSPEIDRFWIEIVSATSTGQYGSQSALTDHMVRWAGQNHCKYEPDTIRKKVGALYREMGWKDGKPED